mmetsp:Transcript_3827/g.7247  ORF Transcript_3827/g.7247 Transcript_3827/m.7247 type:complete len:467 (-) Transcript_3827:521-1921(-)
MYELEVLLAPCELVFELLRAEVDEQGAELIGHGLSHKSLATSRRAVEQHAPDIVLRQELLLDLKAPEGQDGVLRDAGPELRHARVLGSPPLLILPLLRVDDPSEVVEVADQVLDTHVIDVVDHLVLDEDAEHVIRVHVLDIGKLGSRERLFLLAFPLLSFLPLLPFLLPLALALLPLGVLLRDLGKAVLKHLVDLLLQLRLDLLPDDPLLGQFRVVFLDEVVALVPILPDIIIVFAVSLHFLCELRLAVKRRFLDGLGLLLALLLLVLLGILLVLLVLPPLLGIRGFGFWHRRGIFFQVEVLEGFGYDGFLRDVISYPIGPLLPESISHLRPLLLQNLKPQVLERLLISLLVVQLLLLPFLVAERQVVLQLVVVVSSGLHAYEHELLVPLTDCVAAGVVTPEETLDVRCGDLRVRVHRRAVDDEVLLSPVVVPHFLDKVSPLLALPSTLVPLDSLNGLFVGHLTHR